MNEGNDLDLIEVSRFGWITLIVSESTLILSLPGRNFERVPCVLVMVEGACAEYHETQSD